MRVIALVAIGGTHDDWPTYDRVIAEERRTPILIIPPRVSATPQRGLSTVKSLGNASTLRRLLQRPTMRNQRHERALRAILRGALSQQGGDSERCDAGCPARADGRLSGPDQGTMSHMPQPETSSLQRFDFDPAYDVELGPEFPGGGEWLYPVFAFDRDGHLDPQFVSRWGAPVIAVIHPQRGEQWVGMFPAGGLGGVSGAFATPSAQHLCIVADGEAFLVRTDAPQEGALVVQDQVRQVAVASTTLLLLVRDIDIVAVGARGVAWRSPRLAVDDLRVTTAGPTAIHCTGDLLAGRVVDLIVNAATGCVASGPRLDGPPWNPPASPPPEAAF
jgi:hypothetical protein